MTLLALAAALFCQSAPLHALVPTKNVTLDNLIKFSLGRLPKDYYNLNKVERETTLGEVFAKHPLRYRADTPVLLSVGDINSPQSLSYGSTKRGEIAILKFSDSVTAKQLYPWIWAAAKGNKSGIQWHNNGLVLGEPWLASRDNIIVMVFNDERVPLIEMSHDLAAHFGLRESSNFSCATEKEERTVKGEWVLAPGAKRDIPLSMTKELMAYFFRWAAVRQSGSKHSLRAWLLPPGQSESHAIALPDNYDWDKEYWLRLSSSYLSSRGPWKLRIQNQSSFHEAKIKGWGLEVIGFSPDSCGEDKLAAL